MIAYALLRYSHDISEFENQIERRSMQASLGEYLKYACAAMVVALHASEG